MACLFFLDFNFSFRIICFFSLKKKNPAAATIDMKDDLERLKNPLEKFVENETNDQSGETKIYFDNLHFSPLKVKQLIHFDKKKDSCQFFNAWIFSK